MCGIVAAVSRAGGVSADALRRATRRLDHRGPDAQHVWIDPSCTVGLGHARLSIIDLTTGDQPIANEDGRFHIVHNGEFYDFERIRCDLERRGHRFSTKSDSEIALHLYEEQGPQALHTLRGEFAFAIWDAREKKLFAGRDRFGIKPLYYTSHNGAVYLASEVKAFIELGVPLTWDRETLYDIHYVTHKPDRSLFAGVYQVPPGHYLVTDGENVRVLPYWDFDYPAAADLPRTRDPREFVEEFTQKFEDAVRVRLRADVPVACYLSGGIDSCAVLGFASKLSPNPIRAYTLSFDHADYDERAIAEEQSALSGAEFRKIDIRAEHTADNFADALYHAERPFANAHIVAKYLLSKAVRDDGIKVVLTGEGSDEILAGYAHFRRDAVLYGDNGLDAGSKQKLLDQLEAANRVSAGTLLPGPGTSVLESVRQRLGFVPSQLEAWAGIGNGLLGLASADFMAEFANRDVHRELLASFDVERQMAGRDAVNQSLYVWGKTMLPNYILSNLGDRMEMAHSVEGRLPFLDHHVVEAVAKMPVSVKINGMTEKWLLRESARPVLTDTVYKRQKHPFLSPPATTQQEGRLFTMLQDTLRSQMLDGPGIYDRRKVTAMLDAAPNMDPAGRNRLDAALMWMSSICLLHQQLEM